MQEVFEKIIKKLEEIAVQEDAPIYEGDRESDNYIRCSNAIEAVEQAAAEYNNGWIPCSERMPKEHESMLAKFKGTAKWKNQMFEKISDEVNVTVIDEKGKCTTNHAHTIDGEWSCDILKVFKTYRIIAWQPLPEPYQPEGNPEPKKKTNFDYCCQSAEIMAQVIDIAKCGWTKEEIINWLQSEAKEI